MPHTPMTGAIDVFCVGDSTTKGTLLTGPQLPDNLSQAYRLALSDALQADIIGGDIPPGVSFTFVGPNNFGSAPSNNCYAVSGITTAGSFVGMPVACQSVTGSQVVVIMYLGLNDVNDIPIAEFPLNYLSAVRRLHNLLRDKNPRFVFSLLNSAWNPSGVDPFRS